MEGSLRSITEAMLETRVWKPEGEIRAIVQILHGMAEHIDCYEETARRLNQAGVLVVGHNHLGHGQGAQQLGYFGKGGFDALVDDAHAMRLETQKAYPGVPYFLLGHSMGSFVARNYCLVYERGLSGVILSGTGHFPPMLVTEGLILANLFCALGREKKPAKFLETMSFAGYNREWSPVRTQKDWISSNTEKVDNYIADPLCGFPFTNGAYRDLFRGLKKLYPKNLAAMDKTVPILLYAGASDPVGGSGQGVQKVATELKVSGVQDVTVKLYENGRHEMHNEPNREEVFQNMLDWMFSRL